MKKNLYFIFIAASFALLAVTPGRLAYGIPLILELNLLLAGASAFNELTKKIDLGDLHEILTLAFIIFLAIFFKQLLILYSPVVALTLSFAVYLPAVSAFLLACVFSNQGNALAKNAGLGARFSAFAFLFFLLRDILGYGSISLPARNGIVEALLFDSYKTSFFSLFASAPGAVMLLAACMAFLLAVQKKMNAIEKSGTGDEND